MTERRELLGFALILILGIGLRGESLDRAVFSHPENYAPGWDDPAWVTAPYARRSTLEGVLRGVLGDGHPPLWFVAMLPWVRATGDSLVALRLPSVVAGALCLFVLWRLVRRTAGPGAGLLAAFWLAVHGHHVFWSRLARMYAPGCLLALLAAWALVRLLADPRRRFVVAYVTAATALVWTQIYGFPLLLAHGFIAMGAAATRRPGGRTALRGVATAVALGAPVLSLAVYQNPPTAWADPWAEHLSFGFAFYSDLHRFTGDPAAWPQVLAAAPTLLALAAAATAVARGFGVPAATATAPAAPPAPAPGPPIALRRGFLIVAAALATAAQSAFAARFGRYSAGDERVLYALCAFPALVVGGEALAARLAGVGPPAVWRVLGSPNLCQALVPFGAMALVSLARPSFVARGALLFLPFLLAAAAEGVAYLRSRPSVARRVGGAALAVCLCAVAVASCVRFHGAESSPRDYRTFADRLGPELGADGLVAVQGGYADPPLLYYLRGHRDRVVPFGALTEVFPDHARRRVFAVVYDGDPFDPMELGYLAGRRVGREIRAHRTRAIEFLPR